jgi:fumarate reductase flavoprotein subunit
MNSLLNRRQFVGAAAALGAVGTLGAAAGAALADEVPAVGAYDVIVLGAGGAGMCAAIAAKEAGAQDVIIFESMAICGGNTSYSSSGMNAAYTVYQQEAGIEDSVELFVSDTVAGGHNKNNVALVEQLCEGSAAGVDWVAAHGLELSDVTTMAGASVPRCHRPADKTAIGANLVPALEAAAEEAGIQIVYGTAATKLVVEDGAVTGVEVEGPDGPATYTAGAVVLATGGFGANFDMIKMYRPDLADYVTTNAPGVQGDGMVMAQAAGANLIQMDQIQIHPTVYQETGALIGEAVRGGGGILVNANGERFTNEMGTRDVVSAAELEQPDGKVWCLYDQTLYDANKVCASYENREMSIKGETLEELCDALGIDAAAVQATLDVYNETVTGAEDPFGRTTGLVEPLATAPFYAIPCSPGIHHCMGGVYVDGDSQALTIKGEKVPGLYAAGEVTGGIHGDNRLGGNAVCDIVVMGINAGQKAAAAALA